jgi:hypothetical protein
MVDNSPSHQGESLRTLKSYLDEQSEVISSRRRNIRLRVWCDRTGEAEERIGVEDCLARRIMGPITLSQNLVQSGAR